MTTITMAERVARWGGARVSRRVARSMPWVGAGIALATAFATIRRKGVISGTLDTGLNAVPIVGAAKNILEFVRGRDFFPDRYGPGRPRVAAPENRSGSLVTSPPSGGLQQDGD